MKNLICFIALLGFAQLSKAQDFELMRPNIKKKKLRYCTATREYVNKETQTAGDVHNYGAWTFNTDGKLASYERFDDAGKPTLKGKNSYDAQGRITLTEEDNIHIDEHERIIYEYDAKGRLTNKKDYRDEKLLVTYQHHYGDDMLRDSTIWLDKNNQPELMEYYKYNDAGWKIEQYEKTDNGRADGKTIFEYHEDGTLKDEILYDGFGNIFERMYYNEDGLLIKKEVSYIDYQIVYEYFYTKKGVLDYYTKSQSNQPKYERISFDWSKKIP